ncbi:MAG: DUF4276 family protein [Limisphaerales bacterium]
MSGSFFIAPIVEGHGEVQAVPILLRRLIADAKPNAQLWLNPALRVKAGSFINDDDYFKKYLELAARKTKPWPNSCVLILLDCEDECPAELGPRLLEKARVCRSDVTIIVILAHREYETWFLAAARSLRGVCGLPADLDPPDDPELHRDAKGWLSAKMNQPYNETDHQPKLTAAFAFQEAMVVDSFSRAVRKLYPFFQT